ncbi:aldehyde dehydrogenase [Nocardioides immobilis]|uniref:aldehyde dehydrogenase (NAD(+)) n=1 Tax=Nocardioides immobilis TaxID=2049295 RepID=A0A417XTZ0_9ACTN|nr:aldehyde dehydrogenase [Nocardioides immobilis]RHW23780.1 aldehyde dehydrogenase [Nocardioides immobilis]
MVWTGKFDRLFIGGRWVEPSSSGRIDVVSPSTEEAFAEVVSGGRADVDQAVDAARTAMEGPWARTSVEERIALLRRFSAGYEARREVMANLITHEMGCPIGLSRMLQATNPQRIIDTYADLAGTYPFSELRQTSTGNALVRREPVGVVAAVVPWNAPQVLTMLKLAPALVAGCTMVLKPSPETPLDAYLMAEILEEAGLPEGVLNIVPADRDVSEYLVSHAGVDKVTFTGSTAAGQMIASRCGQDLRRVTLELGGKSASIILDDADMDLAVGAVEGASLRNAGQACSAKTRLVVSTRRKSELLERLVAVVGGLTVGDPFDEGTDIGPLVTSRQRDIVEGYIASGVAQGATLVVGGGRPALDRGWFVQPTVFADVHPDMRIAQEEIFGPVLSVLTYEDEDEAVAIANNSVYGLSGSIFTSDEEHGLDLAKRIRTGTVELNGAAAGYEAPMGGFKNSGIGREFATEGLDGYVEYKSIGISESLAGSLPKMRG